jgi:hypothetical protein
MDCAAADSPYVGGGFGNFYAYAPVKIKYAIDRFTMELKRQLDVLDRQLADNHFIAGDEYTIADMAIWPWYGNGMLNGASYNDARKFLGTKEKAPPKEGRDQHLGTRGDGLPSRCIRRYRLPPRSTRQKFHARPEQGNGPAADGASFSLNSNLLECGRNRFFLPVPRQFGAWGIVPPAFITASVNCVRAEALSRLTSSLRETRLRGWACEIRTQKRRRKLSF